MTRPVRLLLAGATALALVAGSAGTAAATPPANDAERLAQLQARRSRLQALLDRLGDADGMTARDARDLLAAYGDFHHELRRGDFSFTEAGIGLGTGALGSALAGEGAGLAGGLWGLAITAYLQVIGDGLYNAALIDMAIDNTAMYGWLVDHVHYRRTGAIEDRLLTWFDDHAELLQRVTGEPPPRRHYRAFLGIDVLARDRYDNAEVRAYLQRHAVRLLFFLGMLEETHGPAAFPRYIFASTDPVLRRNGYRAILRPVLQRELRSLIQEIDRVLDARRTSMTPATGPGDTALVAADLAPVLGLTGTTPSAATAVLDGVSAPVGSAVDLLADTDGGVGGGDATTPAAAGAGILRL